MKKEKREKIKPTYEGCPHLAARNLITYAANGQLINEEKADAAIRLLATGESRITALFDLLKMQDDLKELFHATRIESFFITRQIGNATKYQKQMNDALEKASKKMAYVQNAVNDYLSIEEDKIEKGKEDPDDKG